jgi:hypothetical protein
MVDAPAADWLVVDQQGDLAAGGRPGGVGGEHQLDGDLAGGERLGRLLVVDGHAHHRVGVLQLAVVDEQREAAQVVASATSTPSAPPSGTWSSALMVYEWL